MTRLDDRLENPRQIPLTGRWLVEHGFPVERNPWVAHLRPNVLDVAFATDPSTDHIHDVQNIRQSTVEFPLIDLARPLRAEQSLRAILLDVAACGFHFNIAVGLAPYGDGPRRPQ